MKPQTDKLLAALKAHAPTKVRAFASDDDFRDVAVPQRRKRWTQVVETVNARAWVRVELLNKAGEVMAYVDNTSPAGDLEDIGAAVPHGGQVLLAERIVGMVVKAQRETMAYRDAEVTALLKAQGDVVREMAAGMRALSEVYREQVDAAENAAELRATAAVGDSSQLKELIEAAPVILQLLPVLRSMLGTGDNTPTAPNGARKTS